MFGEEGWVSREIPERLIASKQLKGGSEIFTVRDSIHHLYNDQPDECVSQIIRFTLGQEMEESFQNRLKEEKENSEIETSIIGQHNKQLKITELVASKVVASKVFKKLMRNKE